MTDNDDIIRAAALNYLHGIDDFGGPQLKRLADALGVPHGDVEAIIPDPHPEHTECADGCGLAVTHDGACLDKPGGRQVCDHDNTEED